MQAQPTWEFSAQPLACGLQELLSPLLRSCLRLNVFLNGANEIFRQRVVVRLPKPKKSIVAVADVRAIQTNDIRRRTCSPVSHPDTAATGSDDQLEHCSDSGCSHDPAPSRDQATHIGHF